MTPNRNRGIAAYTAIAAVLLISIIIIFPKLLQSGDKKEYSEVIKNFDKYKVSSYTLDLGTGELVYKLIGDDKEYKYEVPNVSIFLDDTDTDTKDYRTEYNKLHPDTPLAQDYKKIKDNSWIISVVPSILLLILGVALFFFMMKQTGGGGKYSSFGKANIKNQAHNNGKRVTFADVAGADEEKHEMEEIVDFLKNPKSTRKSVQEYQREYCFWVLPVQVKRCLQKRLPAKRVVRFSRFQVRTLSRCLSASARQEYAICLNRLRKMLLQLYL